MAGIGKYKKGVAFTLKSGNKPSFTQMGSRSSTPLLADTEKTTEDETPKVKEEDSRKVKIGKILGNALIGGSNAALGTKIHEFKINRGENEEKIDKEAEAKTIEQKMDEQIGEVKSFDWKNEDGTDKSIEEYDEWFRKNKQQS